MIYLASPYSAPSAELRQKRFEQVARVCADLFQEGVIVFSPISHCHPIAQYGGVPGDWQFWEKYDTEMISLSEKLVVLKLDGWQDSKGVTAEIALAVKLGKPVEYLEYDPAKYEPAYNV